jgi:hypothetical protein
MHRRTLDLGWLLVVVSAIGCGSSGGGAGGTDDATTAPDADASVAETTPGDDATSPPDAAPGDATPDGTAPDAADTGVVATQPISPNIVVDQIGYPTAAEKIAVIRVAQTGFDKGGSYAVAAKYALVDAHTGAKVLEKAATAWNGGATDASSGDKAWWFDFSSVTTPSDYFVLDETANVRSDVFRVADDVYRDELVQSLRMFYYQRDNTSKDAKYAGAAWADGPEHLGTNQGAQCGLYTDGSAKKDLRGGWWDAGDLNKYVNWGASDVILLLRAFTENQTAFGDANGIPESGNGVADVLDEAKWELDWLVRMQNADGSVLSIVGQEGAKSPDFGGSKNTAPSTDTSPCKYGPVNTSATLSAAAVFAKASMVYAAAPGVASAYPGFADDLAARAKKAWTWANANPSVTFYNGGKVGAGEQETDDAGRKARKIQAAVFLYALTKDTTYRSFVDANYKSIQLAGSGYLDVFDQENTDALLDYAKISGATAATATGIESAFKSGVASDNNLGGVRKNRDPYLAYLYVYTWGSNQVKSDQGNLIYDVVAYGLDATASADASRGALRYVHYMNGVNPLSLVYLSNMGDHGASKSITRFYHSWFGHGSDWDAWGVSKYGPPPGYLVGGPNPSYAWDGCCPSGCSGFSCGSAPPAPPSGQPDQKAYKDFNDNWPLDSWSISEPDDGYQAKWVRLLSKFVK